MERIVIFMKTDEVEMLLRSLKADGLWRKDALFKIMLCMEADAPWLAGGTREGGAVWGPENPWIDERREAKYFELLRLGCQCIREFKSQSGQDIADIVQFGLNVYYDILGLKMSGNNTYRSAPLNRLLLAIRNAGLVPLFSPLYEGTHRVSSRPMVLKINFPESKWVISQMQ